MHKKTYAIKRLSIKLSQTLNKTLNPTSAPPVISILTNTKILFIKLKSSINTFLAINSNITVMTGVEKNQNVESINK